MNFEYFQVAQERVAGADAELPLLNNFGNPDDSIDWEKLMRFNSGKENAAWIASGE